MPRLVSRRVALALTRGLLYAIGLILALGGIALGLLETAWAKDHLRDFIASQANQYLAATLEIGRLEGSLLRGVRLTDVRLSTDADAVVGIDEVSLSYSLRELFDGGVVIRQIRVVRPRVIVARLADGRWNLGALVRRDRGEGEPGGPGRPIHIPSIEVVDGDVSLRDPLTVGAVHVPARYAALNVSLSLDYEPGELRLDFAQASWDGGPSNLTMHRLSGGIATGGGGWTFDNLAVQTPLSSFALAGRIVRSQTPTTVDVQVKADSFSFREWAVVVPGLRYLGVDAAFEVDLEGPLARLTTGLNLRSTGGAVRGALVLDTTVPGWRGAGSVNVARLDLSRWMNRPDRPSDISGRVDFDLALELGRGFPRGSYTFDGPHAAFLEYEGDDVWARGTITAKEVLIAEATATAYGANVRLDAGSIAVASPYPFSFRGTADGVDLRRVPASVPVPRVESTLTFDYDLQGRFVRPFIRGGATFADSQFLGAVIGVGAVGTIDTAATPLRYSGEGDISGIDLHRFGAGLDVGWMQDARYAGLVSGHFRVEAAGADAGTMTLAGGVHLARANLFEGALTEADVSIAIAGGSLTASYSGSFSSLNPAIALDDPRFAASLSGAGRASITVRDLFVRTPSLGDYDVDGRVSLTASAVRGLRLDSGTIVATLADQLVTVTTMRVEGPAIEGEGAGAVALDGQRSSRFTYDIGRADLRLASELFGSEAAGEIATRGQLTGPADRLQVVGTATIARLDVAGLTALTTTGEYDVTMPLQDPARAIVRVTGKALSVEAFNQSLQEAGWTVTYADHRVDVDVRITRREGWTGTVMGALTLHPDWRAVDLSSLTLSLQGVAWRLVAADPPPTVRWDDEGVAVSPLSFVDGASGEQQIGVAGTWRSDGSGALRITATRLFLDTFAWSAERPARYGGVVDLDATVRGTRDLPIVTGQVTVTEGRIRRLAYERLAGRVDYGERMLNVDLRLDQAPGVWLTAKGSVPLALFDPELPEQPLNVAITSSAVSLGLVEGVTDVVRAVSGEVRLNVIAIGTSQDPHFVGTVELTNAGFLVASTGARYKNGYVALQLSRDRVSVGRFYLEDNNGRVLEVGGSLGTHELRVGDVAIDVSARRFELLRNEFGTVEVDASLRIRGQFEAPRIFGQIAVAGGELKVDAILDRVLFQPYATQAAPSPELDAVAALNPWDRLGLDIELRVPGTLRMTGESVQVSPGTPLGLGSFNLRVNGDLYLFKDPAQPFYVNGSFHSVTGTYAFQSRRFDIDPASSINFRGDLNPELYVSVDRSISGVQARVTIAGALTQPELRLTSRPPLDASDILSLIVFNTSMNQLSAAQRQELAVRAGTLAAGFLTTPLLAALERSLGLDLLEIEGPQFGSTGPRVTVGDEIAPGLVARFSRQFGQDEYDEATIEYYLSRILRLRATFSDAGALISRSPFRRVERAGIDLLLFFSF